MKVLIFLVALTFNSAFAQINWQIGNWALACDFKENNLNSVKVRGEECGGICYQNSQCTHFVWSTYNGGTCWLKSGSVSKSDAIYTGDFSMSCGITRENTDGNGNGEVSSTTAKPGPVDNNKWPGCQLKYGRDWDGEGKNYGVYDYITFWIGANSCDNGKCCVTGAHCTDYNDGWEGVMLRTAKQLNKPVVLYGYIIAFEARVNEGLYDCNDPINPGPPNLCTNGAQFIRNRRQLILDRYELHSGKIADIMGTSATTIFIIEPDIHQYLDGTRNNQVGGPLSGQYIRSFFDDIVKSIKKNLPNALISWDVSPWISEQDMREWWGYFNGAQIDFINTSGGGNRGESEMIQGWHGLTWKFMNQLTGKKMIADCGYGVVGT